MDTWDGYRASRSRIQQGWVQRGVRNPVVLTGDVHRAWANDLKADYANPNSATIGTELVCTSITSGGDGSGSTTIPNAATNPHLRFYSDRRGYVRTTIGATQLRADFRTVGSVTEPGAPVGTACVVRHPGRPARPAKTVGTDAPHPGARRLRPPHHLGLRTSRDCSARRQGGDHVLARHRSGRPRGTDADGRQVIGWVGSTGHSTGPHLHFQVHLVAPPVDSSTAVDLVAHLASVGVKV